MQLDIISPDKNIFSGEASAVKLPGIGGSFGILDNHAPLISALKAGDIKVTSANGEENFTVTGGVVEVLKNKVIILAE